MTTRSPMDQLLDGVEWTARGEAPPEDATMPYATHGGVLHLGDHALRVARLIDGRAVIDRDDLIAFFGADTLKALGLEL